MRDRPIHDEASAQLSSHRALSVRISHIADELRDAIQICRNNAKAPGTFDEKQAWLGMADRLAATTKTAPVAAKASAQ